ncbi:hypothetical protein [Bordetella genomosp. 9]|uniref:Uncharacterized protein n=1 Tax=Bordetella genomosp. 9 TaxID=1416803 RepID=A0A1W6Z064_9BORD|nr:hypothetical protein [Bordetella genomosp. 9]ARP86745.1 hypothetical protein CAL13_11405 [Bordetella genomosp. 9]
MHYRHPQIGFAFELPSDWRLDRTGLTAEGVLVSHKLGEIRLLLQVRQAHGNAGARLALMQRHLESVRAARIVPCQPPPFGQSRDIVALGYELGDRQQRWISVCHEGYDYTLTHTGDWQEVVAAVDRLATSFVFPAPAAIRRVLPDTPEAQGPAAAAPPVPPETVARPARGKATNGHVAAPSPSARPKAFLKAPSRPAPRISSLWMRISERLRRVW